MHVVELDLRNVGEKRWGARALGRTEWSSVVGGSQGQTSRVAMLVKKKLILLV